MDEISSATRELADLLKNSRQGESSLTIKWAAVISILTLVCAGLFGGYVTNVTKIARLETKFDYAVASIGEFKTSQERMERIIEEIRFDQKRREAKERR